MECTVELDRNGKVISVGKGMPVEAIGKSLENAVPIFRMAKWRLTRKTPSVLTYFKEDPAPAQATAAR